MSDNAPDYQATLAGWFENAEQVDIDSGDTVIEKTRHGFDIWVAGPDSPQTTSRTRILSRATPPKPSWHDAVAVVAHTEDDDTRRAFIPRYLSTGERSGDWEDRDSGWEASLLIDPVPLIEARATEDAALRVIAFLESEGSYVTQSQAQDIVTAALGIGDA